MGIYKIKPQFQRLLKPIEQYFIKRKVHPTTINLIGLGTSLLGGVALYYAQENLWLLLFIPCMAFIRTAMNALDGMVARALAVENQAFGEVLNEFLDRVSDAAIFLGLALAAYTHTTLGVLTLVAILLNSYLSIVSKAAGGKRQYGGIMGKADRMIYIGITAVIIFMTHDFHWANYFLGVTLLGTVITLGQRFRQTHQDLVT